MILLRNVELQISLNADSSHSAHIKSYSVSTFQDLDSDKIHTSWPIPHSPCGLGGRTVSMALILTWYLCSFFAGAKEEKTLSLVVTLCQCTAS